MADLPAELRRWCRDTDDDGVTAAVWLLLEDGYWLRNDAFLSVAVVNAVDGRYLTWRAVRDALHRGAFDAVAGTTVQRAVLEFAVALALDDFHLKNMGPVLQSFLFRALNIACGGEA